MKGLLGKKVGMTQIFDESGAAIPVTLIEAGPCYVTQIRNPERDGYLAVQLGFVEAGPKRLTGGQLGHLKRHDLPALSACVVVAGVRTLANCWRNCACAVSGARGANGSCSNRYG